MKFHFILICISTMFLAPACSRKSETAVATPDIQALQTRTFESIWSRINENYVYADFNGVDWTAVHDDYSSTLDEELSPDEFSALIDSMLAELPLGTAWIQSREERIRRASVDNTSYEGIGSFVALRLEPEPHIILLEVMPESPAEEAGLRAHDAILAIDGEPVKGDDEAGEIERVRGPASSRVTLTVRSPGEESRDVQVTRGRITGFQAGLEWTTIMDGQIGYVLFPPVNYSALPSDFASGLVELAAETSLEGIIIDLRIVSASTSWPVSSLLALFIDGEVGELHSRNDIFPIIISGDFDTAGSQELPIAVLVGPDTSGAAEIFASSIQSINKGIVIGMNTPGEVESISSYRLPDGSQAFVATTTYRASSGREIGLHGVEPDIVVEADWDEVTTDDDPVLNAAINALQSNGR